MKGRRAWKKALAGVLTGTLLIGTLSTVSASSAVSDVDASGWWVNHSEGIALADGTKTTITFTGTTYADYYDNWDTPIYVVYSADEAFAGGEGISDTAGYTEYYVMRADVYGWGDNGNYTTVNTPEDWSVWVEESQKGTTGTITAVRNGNYVLIDYVYGDINSENSYAESITSIYIGDTDNAYLSLTGEYCTVTDIAYETTDDVEYSIELTVDSDAPIVDEEVKVEATVTVGGITLVNRLFGYGIEYSVTASNYDYWKVSNFAAIIQSYEAGDVTVGVTLYDSNDNTLAAASTTYAVSAAPTVTLSNLPTSFAVGNDLNLQDVTLTETYADGHTETVTFDGNYAEGDTYHYDAEFLDQDGNYVSTAEEVGSVYAIITRALNSSYQYAGRITTDSIPVTANGLDEGVTVTPLTLDVPVEVSLSEEASEQWFSFTPTESGFYDFVSSDNAFVSENGDTNNYNVYAYLYETDSDGLLVAYKGGSDYTSNGNFRLSYYLLAGVTYYYQTNAYESVAVYSVELSEKDITTIELLDQEYSTTAESYSEAWYSYTPSADGQYYVVGSYTTDAAATEFGGSVSGVFYYDEDGAYCRADYVYDEDDEDDDQRVTVTVGDDIYYVYSLKAGVKYYINYYYYGAYYLYDYDAGTVTFETYDGTVTLSVSEVNHVHTYADKNITWIWAEDYSSATAALRCDTCTDVVTLTATVTSTTTDATATTDGSTVYTATAANADVEYTDTQTVVISAAGTSADTENTEDVDAEDSDSEDTDTEDADSEASDSEDADSEDSDSEDADSEDSDSEDSGSDEADAVIEEAALTSTTAWSSVTSEEAIVSGDSVITYSVTIDEAYGDDWFSVEVYDGDGNYITLNSDGTYWYYGTEGDEIVMTGSAITLEEGATYTVEVIREGSDFTVTFYDEDGNELLSYYAANTNIDEVAASHIYAQVGSYTVSGEVYGTVASELSSVQEPDSNGDDGDTNSGTDSNDNGTASTSSSGSITTDSSPKTGDVSFPMFVLIAFLGCVLATVGAKKRIHG